MQISDALLRLKRERELREKPFPVWALLILYQKAPRLLYNNYFEGFKLLKEWLSPIELTPHSEPIPLLYRNYTIQELAVILDTTQENLNHGYQTSLSILQLTSNAAFVPTKVSIKTIECNSP